MVLKCQEGREFIMTKIGKKILMPEKIQLYGAESKVNSQGVCGSKTNQNSTCGGKTNSGISCGGKTNRC